MDGAESTEMPQGDANVSDNKKLSNCLELIDKHFDNITIENCYLFLPTLHRAISVAAEKELETDVGEHLWPLLQRHQFPNEKNHIVLQILFQILKSLNTVDKDYKAVYFGTNIFPKLIDLLFSSQDQQINANALACLKLYIVKFNSKETTEEIWSRIISRDNTANHSDLLLSTQILVHLFEEFCAYIPQFCNNEQFITIIRNLLISEISEERKACVFLMRKSNKVLLTELCNMGSQWTCKVDENINHFWTNYIAIIEHLDDNQFHLILPALNALKSINIRNSVTETWLNLLYKHLLNRNNPQVSRCSLEFILDSFTCAELSDEVLLEFLKATNETNLYNRNAYFLPTENFAKFLNCSRPDFFKLFASINWKSIPLHLWLLQLIENHCPVDVLSVSSELLLQLAKRVCDLENPKIRHVSIYLFEMLFEPIIVAMSLSEYINFVQTLYNASDQMKNANILRQILKNTKFQDDINTEVFPIRLFEVTRKFVSYEIAKIVMKIDCPQNKIIWMRFFVIFSEIDLGKISKFCKTKCDLDAQYLSTLSYSALLDTFCNKLVTHANQNALVREASVQFFIEHNMKNMINNIDNLDALLRNFLDYLNEKSAGRLIGLLVHNNNTKVSFDILAALIKNSKIFWPGLIEYINTVYSTEDAAKLTEQLLHHTKPSTSGESYIGVKLSKDVYIKGILHDENKTEDERIEKSYNHRKSCILRNSTTRVNFVEYLINNTNEDEKTISAVCDELFRLNSELSQQKYAEDSKEHRLKTRISYCIYSVISLEYFRERDCSSYIENIWSIVLNENNHSNIQFVYEILIGLYSKDPNDILNKLKIASEFTPSQQLSIISVANWYARFKKKLKIHLEEIISYLHPLAMGANFSTRLHAQLAIYGILKNTSASNDSLKETIKNALNDSLPELIGDYRYEIYKMTEWCIYWDIIQYVTNAPPGEYFYTMFHDVNAEVLRDLFLKKKKKYAELGNIAKVKTSKVKDDLLMEHNFSSYTGTEQNELFVVTSLIDEVPYVAGLVGIVAKLGLKNVVVESKSIIEKEDYKSLSIKAQKELNILEIKATNLMEFLIEKQTEGFKIVGAEKTAKSIYFNDFKFPKKCILLLGHENSGIPPNLLGFLDYVVEVPHDDKLRSLNVHATGALFMSEYYKQHSMNTQAAF